MDFLDIKESKELNSTKRLIFTIHNDTSGCYKCILTCLKNSSIVIYHSQTGLKNKLIAGKNCQKISQLGFFVYHVHCRFTKTPGLARRLLVSELNTQLVLALGRLQFMFYSHRCVFSNTMPKLTRDIQNFISKIFKTKHFLA